MTFKRRMIWTSGYAIEEQPIRVRFEMTTNATTAAAQPYLGENVNLLDEASNTYVWSNSLLRYVPQQIDSDGEGVEFDGTATSGGGSGDIDGGTPTTNYTSTTPIDGGVP